MAIINTGLLTKGINSAFFERFNADAANTIYQLLCTTVPSTGATEQYKWLGQVPQMREFGTGRLAKGIGKEAYNVDNLKYESTIEVDRDEIADDQTGQIRIRTQELGTAAATHKDYLLAQLLENGGETGFVSYDGLTFFNDAHTIDGSAQTFDNDVAATIAGTTPTTAEMKAAIQSMITALLSVKDGAGRPRSVAQTGLVLIVPPSMQFAAREAVNASVIASTTNVLNGACDVRVFPWLTSTDHAYLCKTDVPMGPFVFQDREPIEFGSLAEGSEEDFKREKFYYGVRARYRVTYGRPENCIRATFAA